MRTIKFRAWDIAEKRMITHPSLWTLDLNGGLFYGNAKMTKNNDVINYPIILMQFTGLTDKNGKEIYEGDIVKDSECSENHVVEIKEYVNADYEDMWTGIGWNLHLCNVENVEVIGNKWENPELMK